MKNWYKLWQESGLSAGMFYKDVVVQGKPVSDKKSLLQKIFIAKQSVKKEYKK